MKHTLFFHPKATFKKNIDHIFAHNSQDGYGHKSIIIVNQYEIKINLENKSKIFLNSIQSINNEILTVPHSYQHLASETVDFRPIVSYRFYQCVTITQVPGMRSSPAVKIYSAQ